MNKEIISRMGFQEEVIAMEQGLCPFCKVPMKDVVFKDEVSQKEGEISGLCQSCQDEIFG